MFSDNIHGNIVWLWLQEKVRESLWSDRQCATSWRTEANERGKQLVTDIKVSSLLVVVLCNHWPHWTALVSHVGHL